MCEKLFNIFLSKYFSYRRYMWTHYMPGLVNSRREIYEHICKLAKAHMKMRA